MVSKQNFLLKRINYKGDRGEFGYFFFYQENLVTCYSLYARNGLFLDEMQGIYLTLGRYEPLGH